MDAFFHSYEYILQNLAKFSALTLEFVGVLIIVVGSVRALLMLFNRMRKRCTNNIVVALGKTLGFALEFLMGAEIIKTVITFDLLGLASLGAIIIIRVVLAVILHWEIHSEKQEDHKNDK